jgi:hypothetical protein
VPGFTVSLAETAGPDLRNYRVDFFKLSGTFRTSGCAGVSATESTGSPTPLQARPDLRGFPIVSVRAARRIRKLLSAGIVDEMLSRQASEDLNAPDAEITQEAD